MMDTYSIDGKKVGKIKFYSHLEKMYIKQQKYAELGRLAVSTHICWCEFDDQECKNTPECPQRNFCQKRAELLAGEQDGQ